MTVRASRSSRARNVAIAGVGEQIERSEGEAQTAGGSSRLPIVGFRMFAADRAEFRPVSFVLSSSCSVVPRTWVLRPHHLAKRSDSPGGAEHADRVGGAP